jgi:L-asparaginase
LAEQGWREWLAEHVPDQVRADWPPADLAPWVQQTVQPETAHGTTILLAHDGRDLAGGVSTSGWGYKYPGRLGDSPVIGAGLYADNRYGAAACTGHGELSIRAGTARSVVLYMKMGMDVMQACLEAVADLRALHRRFQATITLYALNAAGRPAVVTLGDAEPMGYFYWAEGMGQPEEHRATLMAWHE